MMICTEGMEMHIICVHHGSIALCDWVKPKQRKKLLYALSKLMKEENLKFLILTLMSEEQELFKNKWKLRLSFKYKLIS